VYESKDLEGEQLSLPQERPLCTTARNASPGRKASGPPEYFGHGRIGEVWRDETIPDSNPKKNWAWYCGITDYLPFRDSVPAKIGGAFLRKELRATTGAWEYALCRKTSSNKSWPSPES
jgi:hypothetical protein